METNRITEDNIAGIAAPLCILGAFIGGAFWIHSTCREQAIETEKENQASFIKASDDVISIFEKYYPDYNEASENSKIENSSLLELAIRGKTALKCLEEILVYDSQQKESGRSIFLYNNEIVDYNSRFREKSKTVSDYNASEFPEINKSFSRTEYLKQVLIHEITRSSELLTKRSKDSEFGGKQKIDESIFNIATLLKVIATRVENEEQYISGNVIHHRYKTGSSETPIGIISDFQNCQAGLDVLITYLED